MRYATITPRTLCGTLAVIAIAGTTFAAPQPASNLAPSLRWSNGISDHVALMSQSQLTDSITQLASRQGSARVLVTLTNPISQNQRAQLSTQGLTLLNSLGSTHYFATLSKNADAAALSQSPLANISQIQTHQKLHKDLLSGIIHPWAVSNQGPVANSPLKDRIKTESILLEEFTKLGIDPTIAVIVQFHKDADFKANANRLARQLGATVASEIYSVNAAVLHIPASRINDLANDDAVMWAEPPLPEMSTLNAENRTLTGVNTLQTAPYDLDGSGVSVLIYDAGRAAAHSDFGSRLTIGQSDTSSVINHSTHVAGTVGGDGTGSSGNNRGMAPAVDLISYGFEQVGGLQEGFLYTDPGDLEADYTQAVNLYGVNLSNNSIGTNTAPNGFPCDWTGNYGITSALIDSIAAGSLGSPLRIIWANGNERQTTRCTGDDNGNFGEFFSTAPPACAKNHIAVGSVDSNSDLTSSFSSWGPTDDGRIKPDISAPGCQTSSDFGVTSTSSSGGYSTLCGTSMAAPTTAGIAALILQQYRVTFPDRDDLRNATLKALLANTAVDRGNNGPDYQYGYGSIRAIDAVDTVIAENIVESEVAQGATYQAIIIVEPGQSILNVTIAWDDVPGSPNVSPSLVNDLDLRIVNSSGTSFLPWTLNPANPNALAVQNTTDHLNNIEQVTILNPTPGAYTVEVTGFNIAQGPQQSFGLVSSSTLINCSSAGIISIGNNIFTCQGSTTVQVVDCDLNTSDTVIDTVDVLISSDSDTGFMLTLTETAPESAAFTGSFTFADTIGSDLLVSEADTLTATSNDQDDGTGNFVQAVASASIDCTAPILLATSVPLISSDFAQIDAQTNEDTDITIHYGTSPANLDQSIDSVNRDTTHSITIEALTPLTNYFYTIDSTDLAGNTSNHDNSGATYTFKTLNGPTPVYEFLVDDTNPGWATTGDWNFGQPAGNGGDPNSGDTGNNVYGYNLNGEYPDNLPERYLTTELLDFTDITAVNLNFQRWLGIERSVFDHASIDIRVGAGPWQSVWEHTAGNSFQESSWVPHTYDISATADNQQDVQIRWVMGTTDSSVTYSGWNLDDIVFTGVVPLPTCQADFNNDGILDFFDISAFLNLFSASDPAADINNDGQWDFFDISAFLTLFSAGCP